LATFARTAVHKLCFGEAFLQLLNGSMSSTCCRQSSRSCTLKIRQLKSIRRKPSLAF